jgi:hypothetical protein
MKKIKELIKYYLPSNRYEVIAMGISIAFFALLFIIVTPIIQEMIINAVPSSYYLSINEPVTTDSGSYKTGDNVVLSVKQTSKITSSSYTIRELVLYGIDGKEIILKSDDIVGIIKQGERSFVIVFELPEDLEDNKYYIRGLLVFKVRGVEKTIEWMSSSFIVE